jgi:ATP-binding cassette, sub-family E, member 1
MMNVQSIPNSFDAPTASSTNGRSLRLTHRNKQEAATKRMVIINHDKVKAPNSEPFRYFKRVAGACGKSCIQISPHKKVVVSQDACAVCLNRCKQCPGERAVSVVKLPANLTSRPTYQYGINSFKLHGLPVPRPGHVLGLLGSNGKGKSTALKILGGLIQPNFGCVAKHDTPPTWSEIIASYRGSDLQNYFQALTEKRLKIALKPHLDSNFVRRLRGKTVRELMQARDQRGKMDYYCRKLDLNHLLGRKIEELSGGELQRFAAACTLCKDADVYIFDEVTSFLDIKQRLVVTQLIRDLVHGDIVATKKQRADSQCLKKYVIVVEHDLAILDFMADFIQCLYGTNGAFGVVTSRSRVRNGINQFLAGYFSSENMRFRDHELTFKVSTGDFFVEDEETGGEKDTIDSDSVTGAVSYSATSLCCHTPEDNNGKKSAGFTLHVEAGRIRKGECVVLMGENGCGKSTFMNMLAGISTSTSTGTEKADEGYGSSLSPHGISYKVQGVDRNLQRFEGTVQDLMEKEINCALMDRLFRLLVIKPLMVDEITELSVKTLSGGEMQRLAIVLCLGRKAKFYLIDEPSAGLDCEQRVIASKVMKRWVVSHLGQSLVLVEHDLTMAAVMADQIIVYDGIPGVECTAHAPVCVSDGMNAFLKSLSVTTRRDPINYRPRINKRNSRADKQQRAAGEYFKIDADEVGPVATEEQD